MGVNDRHTDLTTGKYQQHAKRSESRETGMNEKTGTPAQLGLTIMTMMRWKRNSLPIIWRYDQKTGVKEFRAQQQSWANGQPTALPSPTKQLCMKLEDRRDARLQQDLLHRKQSEL
jgi:hypothetical protein